MDVSACGDCETPISLIQLPAASHLPTGELQALALAAGIGHYARGHGIGGRFLEAGLDRVAGRNLIARTGADSFETRQEERLSRSLVKRLENLGHKVPIEDAAASHSRSGGDFQER